MTRESWWWRCRRPPPARRHLPRPAGSVPTLASTGSPDANSNAPTPTAAAPIGTTLRGPRLVHRHAGDQAERRIAVVEEPDQRGDRGGTEPEGARQLRHHDRGRRPHDVLVEVVRRRDQPGDHDRIGLRTGPSPHSATDCPAQQSTSETASPPSEVSLYLAFISLAVSAIAETVVSKSTRRSAGISLLAIMKPVHDLTAP